MGSCSFAKAGKELSGGFRYTTNNRMELMAAIAALSALRYPCQVTIFTDSLYLADGIRLGRARRSRANGWMLNRKEKALNHDLWEKLLDLCARHDVSFEWVRGHAGNPENERCDTLSLRTARGADLAPDDGYENPPIAVPPQPSLFEHIAEKH